MTNNSSKTVRGFFLSGIIATLLITTGCANQTVNPRIVGEWTLEGEESEAGITAGTAGTINGNSYLFIAGGKNSSREDNSEAEMHLRILDIDNPARPVEISHMDAVDDEGNILLITDMEISGDTLYAVAGSCLWIIDISNPSAPEEVAKFHTRYWLLKITVSGNYAYITTGTNIIAVDISIPSHPEETGTLDLAPSPLSGFAAAESSLFVIAEDGLHVIDTSDISSLKETGVLPNPVDTGGKEVSFGDIAIDGNYAYITAGALGMYVLDISGPSSPQKIAVFPTDDRASLVSVSEHLVYLTGWQLPLKAGDIQHHLRIIDISDPSQPEEMTSLELPSISQSYWFAEINDYIYWFGTSPNIEIVEIYE